MFRSRKWKLLGYLSDTDDDLICSQLKGAKNARVRIVDISSKLLSKIDWTPCIFQFG